MAINTKNEKREYPPSVGFWPTKSGSGYTTTVDERVLKELARVKLGDTLFWGEIPEKFRKNDRMPTHRVSVLPPRKDENEEQEESLSV